jgi:hypothetical protein
VPLTKDFNETVRERARKDRRFRQALLSEAADCFLAGDVATGKSVLRDYVHATVGFEALGRATKKSPKSLLRMLGPSGNPPGEQSVRDPRVSSEERAHSARSDTARRMNLS